MESSASSKPKQSELYFKAWGTGTNTGVCADFDLSAYHGSSKIFTTDFYTGLSTEHDQSS
jgi:hypothetical protein